MNNFSKSFRPALSVFLAAVLVLAFSFFGAASAFGGVVSPSSSFYVTDEAGVIAPDTEEYIVQKNAEPLYWQNTDPIEHQASELSFVDYYILEVSWDSTQVVNDKETDMVYLTAGMV